MQLRVLVASVVTLLSLQTNVVIAQQAQPFDGRPWNVSTGNASVGFVQHSPIGAFPQKDFIEPPPDEASLKRVKSEGLIAYEDYVAWGAVERTPDNWDWTQHDRMEKAMHAAGLKYVTYTWVHFPPTWLRDDKKSERALMRCTAHDKETNYLSIFDPRTIVWYDHFYKALHDHFGDKIDDVYACILGPYGEGNYPLEVTSWVNMGHCHEGWWCNDEYAVRAFQSAMKAKYGDIAKLNVAWGAGLRRFEDVHWPRELANEKFKPKPEAFKTPQEKRAWLDFITWYHQAIIDFAERSVQTVLKYFPKEKVRLKPGGTAGGINPLTFGTYSPGYAKMAGKYPGIVLQPGDSMGAIFGDKWLGTAYQFYGVKLGTEPASALDKGAFEQRLFSDASAGASQFFTYEFEAHVPEVQKYVSLFTGKPGDTEVALYCPTTLYRLGANLLKTTQPGFPLRDFCDFDVLDELLIQDGALTTKRYKALLLIQADIVDQPILDQFAAFQKAGGKIIAIGDTPVRNVEGKDWPGVSKLIRTAGVSPKLTWISELEPHLLGMKGVDGAHDGLWTCRRGDQTFVFNWTDKPIKKTIDGVDATIDARTIWVKPMK